MSGTPGVATERATTWLQGTLGRHSGRNTPGNISTFRPGKRHPGRRSRRAGHGIRRYTGPQEDALALPPSRSSPDWPARHLRADRFNRQTDQSRGDLHCRAPEPIAAHVVPVNAECPRPQNHIPRKRPFPDTPVSERGTDCDESPGITKITATGTRSGIRQPAKAPEPTVREQLGPKGLRTGGLG